MLKETLNSAFTKAQMSTSCHQKLIITLTKLYKQTPEEEFLKCFLGFVQCTVMQELSNNIYTKRILKFVAHFCLEITKIEEKETSTHSFFTVFIQKILLWADLDLFKLRYNCCCFIVMMLQDIGEEVQLDVSLIDEIQILLLKRTQESKNSIRLKALSACIRLQDPQNLECPVIQTYIDAMSSVNSKVRREATEMIAPNLATISKIRERVRDVEPSVRAVALKRCADIGPIHFKIVDKHQILLWGFKETNKKVRKTFLEYFLPKWLSVYDGNYLKFIGGLKLVADDDDFTKWSYLSKEVMEHFLKEHPVEDIVAVLPINSDKLIDIDKITNDITTFWKILVNILRDTEKMDTFIDTILPELTPFCEYINKFIKSGSTATMDEWKFFEFQLDLYNLLDIAENYDLSDEVGRCTLQSLASNILINSRTTGRVIKKLVTIAHKCSSTIDFFTNDMCQIISEIREPIVEQPPSEDQIRERKFKEAQIRVQINILRDRQEEAVAQRDYQLAQSIEDELHVQTTNLEALLAETPTVGTVRSVKNDDDTLCRCLDILSSVLELKKVDKLTPSLTSCKEHFLIPIITHQGFEPHWRVLKCLGLFSIIDKPTAEKYGKLLCVPLATYRTFPTNNVPTMVQAINGVTDLITLYGVEIVSQGGENNNTNENAPRRKLYNTTMEEQENNVDVTLSSIFEIFLDMLDDEYEEIRHRAVFAITSLIKEEYPMTPSILSRLILKWYNPTTDKLDSNLQFFLGVLIDHFLKYKNSGEVLKETVLPTLTVISRAPKNSPLLDIDMDNFLLFFSEILNIKLSKDELKIFTLDLCMKISEESSDKIVPYLMKFLNLLNLTELDLPAVLELIHRIGMLVENITDRTSMKFIEKVLHKLRLTKTNRENNDGVVNETVLQDLPSEEQNENCSQSMVKIPQVKRKKSRMGRECVVLLEKLNLQENCNDTTLHTIAEDSREMDADNMSIESFSSSKKSDATRQTVVSATSDSELVGIKSVLFRRPFSSSENVNNGAGTSRRSRRVRKKRAFS